MYYTDHVNKTKNPKILRSLLLERGMVAKIRYKPIGKIVSKNYVIFVLQPNWPQNTDGKLHALSLDHVEPDDFMEFAKVYPEILSTHPGIKRLNIPKLHLEIRSQRFYLKEIQNDISYNKAYRTFNRKQIGLVTAVNYNYGKYNKID